MKSKHLTAPKRAGTKGNRAEREARVLGMLETLRRRKPAVFRKMIDLLGEVAAKDKK